MSHLTGKRFNMNKTEILNILKKNGYGNIDSDKKGSYHSIHSIPYRDRDGKIIKGISLYRTSPVTFTDAGYDRGVKIVNDIINELSKIGKVKMLSTFGFVCVVPISDKKGIFIKTAKDYRNGVVYDQTFHFLSFDIKTVNLKQDNFNFETYKDTKETLPELTNEYLDKILGI